MATNEELRNETNFGIAGNPSQIASLPNPLGAVPVEGTNQFYVPPSQLAGNSSSGGGGGIGVGGPVATELSPELKNLIEKAVGLSVSPGRKAALMGHLAGVVGGIQTARERNASDLAQANLTTQPSMLTAKANMESARAFSGAVGGIGKSQGQLQQPRPTWSNLFDNLTTKKNPLGTLGG